MSLHILLELMFLNCPCLDPSLISYFLVSLLFFVSLLIFFNVESKVESFKDSTNTWHCDKVMCNVAVTSCRCRIDKQRRRNVNAKTSKLEVIPKFDIKFNSPYTADGLMKTLLEY